MANRTNRTPKCQALRQTGTLHPRPDRVSDELFADSDFFDPNDLLQVKYEMLRRVRRDDFTVRQAAELFGFSRPSFYQAQEAFARGGLGALVPQKRGPRGAHKLSQKIVAFLERTIAADPGADLVAAVQQAFGLSVHRRSIERALARAKKNDASDDRARSQGRPRAGRAL
jgi:transposase